MAVVVAWTGLGCGGEPDTPLKAELVSEDERVCAAPSGEYLARFSLLESEGTCEDAKQDSWDPMKFDAEGKYLSPAPGLIDCETAQIGCQLAVRCTTPLSATAGALLQAELSADGATISGESRVVLGYKGCDVVVYRVTAKWNPSE